MPRPGNDEGGEQRPSVDDLLVVDERTPIFLGRDAPRPPLRSVRAPAPAFVYYCLHGCCFAVVDAAVDGIPQAELVMKGMYDYQLAEFETVFGQGAVCVIAYEFWSSHPEESLRLGERYLTGANSQVKDGTGSATDVWASKAPKPRGSAGPSQAGGHVSGWKLTVEDLARPTVELLRAFFARHGSAVLRSAAETGHVNCERRR